MALENNPDEREKEHKENDTNHFQGLWLVGGGGMVGEFQSNAGVGGAPFLQLTCSNDGGW